MATPILMPRQGPIGRKLHPDRVDGQGERPGEGRPPGNRIETDKVTFEVECPAEGTVLELFFPESHNLPVLTSIAAVGTPGEYITTLRPGGRASAAAPTLTQPCPAGSPGAPPVVTPSPPYPLTPPGA